MIGGVILLRRIVEKLKPLAQNVAVAVYTLINKRDDSVVIIGAWMGEKFSDNSRFLYQYLYKNKSLQKLKRVIWVTRSEKVNELLNSLGYESYLIGTRESRYWHLRGGIHILCNTAFPQARAKTDIDTRFSWGAKKIQLWHGVGMKSVGAASNEAKKKTISKFHASRLASWCTLGGWNEEYFLSTSKRNAEVNFAISLCKKDHLFISAYPRNCDCLELMPEESEIISKISKFKKCIGYFPTFRTNNSNYVHPLEYPYIKNYILNNDILWVEKPHSAESRPAVYSLGKNTLYLDKNFDLNVLFPYFDVVISDYSSVVFDCAYKNIPVVMYCPDLETFKNGDVGFLFDIESYCQGLIVKDEEDLANHIIKGVSEEYMTDIVKDTYRRIIRDFFENRESEYSQIWKDILEAIK